MTVKKIGVLAVFNGKELVAIVNKDEETRKNIIYTTGEASFEDIEKLLVGNEEKIK